MEFSIDIDTGGTFTDGLVRGNGRWEVVKVDTTPHDLTVCFMNCIEEAARRFGQASAADLLGQTRVVRLSTTVGTNTLIRASGPKLGLVATKGAGERLYCPSGSPNTALGFIIPDDMVVGIEEETDDYGTSLRSPDKRELLASVKHLLERGARKVVVSLGKAPLNPSNELACRQLVLADYHAHFLGSVPLLLSTEVSLEVDDFQRTNATLIDAYLNREMARYLYKADELARNNRLRRPLLIVHATGGVTRVAKTRAIDTCGSGPAAGLFGAAALARLYGLEDVVTMDIGGTSTDVGFVIGGQPVFAAESKITGIPVRMALIETDSIGGGGGSIATVDARSKKLKIGPQSAGALPGPACYGLGGTEATVTDAWVVLGYIDPNYFLGGRRRLDPQLARAVVARKVAEPLGMEVERASLAMVEEMESSAGHLIRQAIDKKGIADKKLSLFAFGGGGGLCCSGVAKAAGLATSHIFSFGSAFCAFGSSCMDVLHNYAMVKRLSLEPGTIGEFNEAVQSMADNAYLDMHGEGFDREKVQISLEVVLAAVNMKSTVRVTWPKLFLEGQADLDSLARPLGSGTSRDVMVQELRLQAVSALAHPEFNTHAPAGESPDEALKGERRAFWEDGFKPARVYEQSRLRCGNVVRGFAIIESEHTTILVPPGTRYSMDQFLNGTLEEE